MKDKQLEDWKSDAIRQIEEVDEQNLKSFNKLDVVDTIERLVIEIESLEKQLDEKEDKVNDLENDVVRLEKEVEEKEIEIDKLETSCQEYSEEIERLTS